MGRPQTYNLDIGSVFGRLTIKGLFSLWPRDSSKRTRQIAKCVCICGTQTEVRRECLTSGDTKSCGCLHKEIVSKRLLKSSSKGRWPLFQSYQKGAAIRNLNFLLSFDDFISLVQKECFYCKSSPHNNHKGFVCGGIDRVDNSRGYEKENCVPCCRRCNRAKDVMSLKEFLLWIENIYNNSIGTP